MHTVTLTKNSQSLMEKAVKITGQTPSAITKKALEVYLEELEDMAAVVAYKSKPQKLTAYDAIKKNFGL